MKKTKRLGEILLASGVVGPGDIAEVLADQNAGEPSRLGDLLVAQGKLTPAQLAQALAEQYDVPFTPLPPLPTAVLDAVPLDFQRAHRLVPIAVEGTTLSVAMADLANTDALAWLRKNWTKVDVFAAAGDEIDALHSALAGEFPVAPPVDLPSVAPPVRSSSPSADDLFGSLEVDAPPAPPAATASALFGDLNLDGDAAAPGLEALAPAPGSSPSGMFELQVESETTEVLDLTTEADDDAGEPAAAAPPAGDAEDADDEMFFEAKLSAPSPAPLAAPPTVAPVQVAPREPESDEAEAPTLAEFLDGVPDGEPVPPLRDDTFVPARERSALEQLFIAPEDPVEAPADADAAPAPPGAVADAVARAGAAVKVVPPAKVVPPPAKPSPATKPGPAKPSPAAKPVPPKSSPAARSAPAKPSPAVPPVPARSPPAEAPAPVQPALAAKAPAPTPAVAEKDLELPDWLRGDGAAAEPSGAPAAAAEDRWTGELEALAPSKLITGVARALVRKGILTEQDVLEALEQKKS